MPAAELVYVDSSAFVKLVLPEPETAALLAALEGAARLVAAEVLEVEVLRATRRGGGDLATARAQLAAVRMLPLSSAIRTRASELDPPSVRSLDAIHLATALSLAERLDRFCTYDERMALAGRQAGLDVLAPG
ncbi:MAG TPA: type II toxin-antitoxin system VapC family toxin [Solirubrobacteraceae bacterium]|nr:type II toxin-antitoxin system VapC family toxin [Solirubrobacteraceae bacterium]